jgi:hypothetical protein
MRPDDEVIVQEPETITEELVETKPKKPKTTKTEVVVEDVILPVLFTKKVNCAGKSWSIHDIAEIPKSELDKLPENYYLVRSLRK